MTVNGTPVSSGPAAIARRVRTAAADAGRGDAPLLAALRAQDPAVADPLWRRFAPTIFRLLRRVLGPDAPIEDAVQVVLLCVFRRGRRLRPRADLTRLVMRTTAGIVQAELRSRKARRSPAGPAALTAVRRLYRVLDRLAAVDRIAFVFHYVEGLDAREVAAVIGKSPRRTERLLRRSLEKVIGDIDDDRVLRQMSRSPS